MRRSVYIFLAVAMAAGFLAGAPLGAQPEHQSMMVIDGKDPLPMTRHIAIGLNKSMVVELPTEVRDVLVSNPKMLDAVVQTSNRASLIGMAPGEANVFFFDRSGQQILTLEVNIERDLTALRDMMTRLLPGSDIRLDAVNDNVVLTGTVRNAVDAVRAAEIASKFVPDEKHVVNMISAESKEQVMLKVSVVEMNRNIIKQLGVDVGVAAQKFGSALIPPNFDPSAVFQAASLFRFPINQQRPPSLIQGGFSSNGNTFGAVIQALEQEGLAHVLAEPNLTAISGETANFLAGGEFPIPVTGNCDASGRNCQTTIEFKKFGVSLAFTPMVLSEGNISLKVGTEVSELSSEGAVILQQITIPALKVRRAQTTVEMPSGGSLVMAGLLSEDTKQAIGGYPGVKNLPILGALFRSRDFLKKETELVVMVTPYMVKAVSKNELNRPDKGFGQSTDEGAYLFGRLNRVYGREPEQAPVGGYKGDYGFIVD